MLALKVSLEADEEDHDADGEKGRAQRFADVSEPGGGGGFGGGVGVGAAVGVGGGGADEVVEEGDCVRVVVRAGGDLAAALLLLLLFLEDCLDVGVDLGREAWCARQERAEGKYIFRSISVAISLVRHSRIEEYSPPLLWICQTRVQPEELGDGDADAGECERGAEPGEKGAFEREVVARDGACVFERDRAILRGELAVPLGFGFGVMRWGR